MESTPIPLKWVGPIRVSGPQAVGEIEVPLATYESPLWPSVARGARVSRACPEGVACRVLDACMTRSVLVEADSAGALHDVVRALPDRMEVLRAAAAEGSRFTRLREGQPQIIGNLLYLRLVFTTGDAAGHNMATAAAERVLNRLLADFPGLRYVSISGNLCCDKKPAAVNAFLGRGRSTVAEAAIPRVACEKILRATPEAIADLNTRKNLLGSLAAGSLRAGNAHFANMLLAFYLATGQDAANIVEGSQGITWAEARPDALYFSVTLPHLIVGTVGSGKGRPEVEAALTRLGCCAPRAPGENADRLAALVAAAVWCGELSLLAAQTRPGELMRAHLALER